VPLGNALRLSVAPTLSLHAAPVRVELGAREAFRLPIVAAGLEVQLELGRINGSPVIPTARWVPSPPPIAASPK
jgi:hypothetical protein